MDSPQLPSSPAKPARRHTMPHFDFVLPSYTRDRRLSSLTAVKTPETIPEHVSTDTSSVGAEQNVAPAEIIENNDRYSLEQMVSYRHGRHVQDKALSRRVRYACFLSIYLQIIVFCFRRFYARQDQIIDQLSTMDERHRSGTAHDERAQRHKRWALILIKTTLLSNIVRHSRRIYVT